MFHLCTTKVVLNVVKSQSHWLGSTGAVSRLWDNMYSSLLLRITDLQEAQEML